MPSQTNNKRLLALEPGMFGPIFVEARGTRRSMRFGARDEVEQSLVDLARPERPVPAYLRAAGWAFSLAAPRKRALLIGLGGGGFVRFLRKRFPRIEIDVVEIDPSVIELAKSHFRIRESRRTRVHNTDAILHLVTNRELYDFILLDAYDGPTLSGRLASKDFFSLAAASLTSGGICAANISLRTRLEESAVCQSFADAFPAGSLDVRMPSDWNRLLVGSLRPLAKAEALRFEARAMDRRREFPFPLAPFAMNARPLGTPKRRRA
jgi:spermidine synthase